MQRLVYSTIIGASVIAAAGTAAGAATLDDVKANGFVQCGVNTGLTGFAAPDDAGAWTGFDVDYCRAIAAAIFDDPEAVRFTPLSAAQRFTALQSGEIDVLVRNSTWTMSRDTQMGIMFTGVNYYDGQGFMVRSDLGVTSAAELDGASVCVQSGTTTELNLADYFAEEGMTFTPVVFENVAEVNAAYDEGRCDVFTTDASGAYATRLQLANPEEHVVLPEIISEEPLGPAVRQGDDQWFELVRWVGFALVNAEEGGVTQANVAEMVMSEDSDVRRLLGGEGEFGTALGLENDWAVQVITAVGNYGEIFERNIGASTPLGIERGLNALWSDGGLQYAPPVR
jgi:general L-amino acid transport system substrate-binding protein